MHGWVSVRAEDELRDAVAIPQMDEQHPAQIAPAMHPAHQDGAFAGVGCAKVPAGMCPAQFA